MKSAIAAIFAASTSNQKKPPSRDDKIIAACFLIAAFAGMGLFAVMLFT